MCLGTGIFPYEVPATDVPHMMAVTHHMAIHHKTVVLSLDVDHLTLALNTEGF